VFSSEKNRGAAVNLNRTCTYVKTLALDRLRMGAKVNVRAVPFFCYVQQLSDGKCGLEAAPHGVFADAPWTLLFHVLA
jgi:hypothetical protein